MTPDEHRLPEEPQEELARALALEGVLRERLAGDGHITFDVFMRLALYHPQFGYYTAGREAVGPHGDYYTSLEVHSLFGEMIARQLRQMWQAMGSPAAFDAVEIGAGKALLCRDVLSTAPALDPAFGRALRYHIVEPFPGLAARQRRLLERAGLAESVSWHGGLAPLGEGSVRGCILSNELVDAFPVHVVELRNGALQEIYVALRAGAFHETAGPPSTPDLETYLARLGVTLAEGQRAEVNLRAVAWMRQAAHALGAGFVLTVDYGFEASALYGPRHPRGSLLCYYRHRASEHPLERIGLQDITSHVDFTTLTRTGEEEGLLTLGLTTQTRFLLGLGISTRAQELQTREGVTLPEALELRSAIARLIDPGGLGKFRVLVQQKGLPEPASLDGLAIRM